MMERLEIHAPWLKEILPHGWPVGTSTLITGPGGSGKPLIGASVVASWLKEGGSVVFLSLQYPRADFIYESLRRVVGLELRDYRGRFAILELDAEMEGMEVLEENRIRGNLVKPLVWKKALETALSILPPGGPGPLVFGSALNLLLFSPTYGQGILETLKETLGQRKGMTSLFSVSSSAKKEMIAELEDVADNLLVARSTRDPFQLFLRIQRMQGGAASAEEVAVPISADPLDEVKEVADHSRKRVIPLVSKL
jgi:KaiC/GvpD/RAD55 family RecA-like ATPase